MYRIEQQIRVLLQFDAMPAPVEVSVPWTVLRYLDTHADRYVAADGSVVYRRRAAARPGRRACGSLTPAACAA